MGKEIKRYASLYHINGIKTIMVYCTCFLPGSCLFPIFVHRFGCWVNEKYDPSKKRNPIRIFLKTIYHIGLHLAVITRKIQIEENAIIGDGLFLSPKGKIIVGAKEIGRNCSIHHNVTIGMGFGPGRVIERPVIGANVWIGPDSVLYGNIKVGDGVVVSKGSVLTKSVPAGCVVQGNPARIIKRNFENSEMLQSCLTDFVWSE